MKLRIRPYTFVIHIDSSKWELQMQCSFLGIKYWKTFGIYNRLEEIKVVKKAFEKILEEEKERERK